MKKTIYIRPTAEVWCLMEEELLAGSAFSSTEDIDITFGGFDDNGSLDPCSREFEIR